MCHFVIMAFGKTGLLPMFRVNDEFISIIIYLSRMLSNIVIVCNIAAKNHIIRLYVY